MTEETKEIYCKLCNYKTIRTNDWMKHINSQKHNRNGEKKLFTILKIFYL